MSPTTLVPTGPTTPTSTYPPGVTLGGGIATSVEVAEFLNTLNGQDLNIEAPIAEEEAREAITLFSVVNVLLASTSQRRVGNEDKIDVLGVLTMFYGLQDNSLSNRIVVNSRDLWRSRLKDNQGSVIVNGQEQNPTIEDELKSLRDNLDLLGQDVMVLGREARRQFNLGLTNDVTGNSDFPRLFRRYVDIAGDPLLTLKLRDEELPGSFTSKEKVGQAYDLLSELKGIILQLVRTLSRYGTIATSRVNKDWAKFETRALRVLGRVGEKRFTEDIDEKRILTVLADVTEKNLETTVSPYFALARNGGKLLDLAFRTYQQSQNFLDNFERQHLLDLFQTGNDVPDFMTTKMRSEALVVKRYPLANWG